MLTNKQVAERFAQGLSSGASGTMFIDGDIVYSYGYHWPIAKRLQWPSALYNSRKYSNTTSKQTTLIIGHLKAAGWLLNDGL